MNPNESQVEQDNDMTPEDAKASLGIATFLQQQMMSQGQSKQPVKAPTAPETAPQQEEQPQNEEPAPQEEKEPQPDPMAEKISEMEKSFSEKLDQIRKELKEDNQREIDTLKKTIQDALKE